MIRIKLAEWLLRSMGATCEYRLKRRDLSSPRHVDGRTIVRDTKLRAVRKRFRTVRIADEQVAHIQLVASVQNRHVQQSTSTGPE